MVENLRNLIDYFITILFLKKNMLIWHTEILLFSAIMATNRQVAKLLICLILVPTSNYRVTQNNWHIFCYYNYDADGGTVARYVMA